jgi:hypothetical protein
MVISSGPASYLNPSSASSETVLSRSLPGENGNPLQTSVDQLSSQFIDQASDWKILTSLSLGNLCSQGARAAVLFRWEPSLSAKALSLGIGLGVEATTFEFFHRTFKTFFPDPSSEGLSSKFSGLRLWSWQGPGSLKDGLLNSLFFFGVFKGSSFLVRRENWIFQQTFQSAAVITAQNAGACLGILPSKNSTLTEQLVETPLNNLQMGAGMELASHFPIRGWIPVGSIPRLDFLSRISLRPFMGPAFLPSFAEENIGILKEKNAPSPPSYSLMTANGDSSAIDDLPTLVKEAIKNKTEALETLKTLAEKKHPWVMNALREVAERNLNGILALIQLDEKGIEEAHLKLKQLDIGQLNFKVRNRGDPLKALTHLAKVGNAQALEILSQEAFYFPSSPAHEIILSMAKKGDSQAWLYLSQLAPRQPRTVEALSHLREQGYEIAAKILRGLDVKYYKIILFFSDKEEMVHPLFHAASAGNLAAFEALAKAALSFDEALVGLAKFGRRGNEAAIGVLKEIAVSRNRKTAERARAALQEVSDFGIPSATQALMELPPILPVPSLPSLVIEKLKSFLNWFRRPQKK